VGSKTVCQGGADGKRAGEWEGALFWWTGEGLGGNGASACNRVSAPPANAPNMDLQLLQVTNALTLELRWTAGDYDRLAKLTGPDSLVVYVEPEYSEQQAHRYPKRYSRTCRDHMTIGSIWSKRQSSDTATSPVPGISQANQDTLHVLL
jgi:hypothetical protein